MQNEPLISVIVPVYKVEQYLDRCVQSIVDQTYKNLEIILVDDGSPDACPAICDAWAKKDERVRVIHKENGGVASARNLGLDDQTGEYVCFVDSDDWIEADMIEALYTNAVRHHADLSGCGLVFDYQNGNSRKWDISYVQELCSSDCAMQEYFKSIDYYCSDVAKLYRTSLIEHTRYDTQLKTGEDCHFNYEMMKKAPVITVDKNRVGYHVMQNMHSLTHANYDNGGNWADNVRGSAKVYEEQKGNKKVEPPAANALAKCIVTSTLHLVHIHLTRSSAMDEIVSIYKRYRPALKKVRLSGFYGVAWRIYLMSPKLFCLGMRCYYVAKHAYYKIKG